jgi:GT2 family glycosyltransferase
MNLFHKKKFDRSLENPFAKRSHLVRFAPLYYLEKNADVRTANIDPWSHYRRHGWREGRNPSPLFDTDFYVNLVKFTPNRYPDPLTHYFKKGRAEGLRAHPIFRDVPTVDIHVGIVTVAYNCSDLAILTVQSVEAAKIDIQVTYFLIDGGSSAAEKTKLRNFVETHVSDKIRLKFIDLEENRGYSGSNNVGISNALETGCSHICLLNPDVVVTDYWLERIIDSCGAFGSPVSNAVGNEQTVPGDYTVEPTKACFDIVNTYASTWAAGFDNIYVTSDFLGFFCAVFSSEIVKLVGFLDERFFPGGFEDLDYCLRVRRAGIDLSIARNVYLHHWGSGSFSNLPMNDRIGHANVNRKKYEDKHGAVWIDWKETLYKSAVDDLRRLTPHVNGRLRAFQERVVQKHRVTCQALLSDHQRDVQAAAKILIEKDEELLAAKENTNVLADILQSISPSNNLLHKLPPLWSSKTITCSTEIDSLPNKVKTTSDLTTLRKYSELFYGCAESLVLLQRPFLWALKLHLPAITALAEVMARHLTVVFANSLDPSTANETDGYDQRVLSIDQRLKERVRLYVKISENHADGFRMRFFKDFVVFDLCSTDPVYTALLFGIVKLAKTIYIHSILPIEDARVRQAVVDSKSTVIIDVHGAVPEEFAMDSSRANAALFERYEKEVISRADWIVCVSNAMIDHLRCKYDHRRDNFILCPVLPQGVELKARREAKERPRVIYAGGVQIWQKINRMAEAVANIRDRADYVIMTGAPEKVRARLIEAGVPAWEAQQNVYSASREEVFVEYTKSDYGFLLRDESVVNRVSCPTKLVEYLAHMVVPILETTNVGDFVQLGMKFVRVDDLRGSGFPTEGERLEMAEANLRVYYEMKRRADDGMQQVARIANDRQ